MLTLLLLAMVIGVTATPWDGVPDDPTPAQAIWVDPKNTTCLGACYTFVVDILTNVTDPPGPACMLRAHHKTSRTKKGKLRGTSPYEF